MDKRQGNVKIYQKTERKGCIFYIFEKRKKKDMT